MDVIENQGPWVYRGDRPDRWGTYRDGEWWYLTDVTPVFENEPPQSPRYLLRSNAIEDVILGVSDPPSAQSVADEIISDRATRLQREREHADANRVWVVFYTDPYDSLHPGVWGVHSSEEKARVDAQECEAQGFTPEITPQVLDVPGGKEWWTL